MNVINVDFSKGNGKMKPMHAVNNGPVYKFGADQRVSNLKAFQDAGIPYQRTHDTSLYNSYGLTHVIDVYAIFPNFDADVDDENSYDFAVTDEYLRICEYAGVKTFYRLGSNIEHWIKKYNTIPPKDFKKWAIICEHIIRHYTQGWANGFTYDIAYWEVWNEPDLDVWNDDLTKHRTWGGTKEEFFDFYHVVASHLKEKFPHLKIGGPAIAGNPEWGREFISQVKAPLDFFSWHRYAYDPKHMRECMEMWRNTLDEFGYTHTESICNEWNYVRGWEGDAWMYTLRADKSLKGAAYIGATMCEGQKGPMDMLMYYDARPGGMNGMFNTDRVSENLKGYYPFYMFNRLYQLQTSVEVSESQDLFTCAASNGEKGGVFICHFNDEDTTPAKDFTISMKGMPKGKKEISVFVLDEERDCTCVQKMRITDKDVEIDLNLPLYACCTIEYAIIQDE